MVILVISGAHTRSVLVSLLCFTVNGIMVLTFLFLVLCEVSVHVFVHYQCELYLVVELYRWNLVQLTFTSQKLTSGFGAWSVSRNSDETGHLAHVLPFLFSQPNVIEK